ncbi:MAG TPA: HalOD1 output domain-containing protein [Halobacteriales archaeon]|nr:HalOD1 output domain-containing protein [Halobacteriales archaeon]
MTRRRDSIDGGASDVDRGERQNPSGWERNGRPSTVVVETVAAALGRPPEELPPLQHHVDADALDALVTRRTGDDGDGVRVTFDYEEFEVTVDSHEGIQLRPASVD